MLTIEFVSTINIVLIIEIVSTRDILIIFKNIVIMFIAGIVSIKDVKQLAIASGVY